MTTSTNDRRFILSLGCPDTRGIVSRISGFIAGLGGWIVEAAYHSDEASGWFHTRQAVRADSVGLTLDEFRDAFAEVAADFGPEVEWKITDSAVRKKMVVLVTREGHCLHDLLGRVEQGDFPAEISAVIGNHPDLESVTRAHGIEFHHVPFPGSAQGRRKAFDEVRTIVDSYDPDAVVLARFMQILPPDLCEAWAGKALNIHHSFLPSFMGARPYHQAYQRGVKLIGATCHFVTSDLDDGPIIEQDVIRVDHTDDVRSMILQGRDIEKLVLSRGLRWHLEDRVQVHGRRTVVFR